MIFLMTPRVALRTKSINILDLSLQACKKHTRNNFGGCWLPIAYNHRLEHFVGIRLLSDI